MSANRDMEVSHNLCGSRLVPGPYRNDVGVEPVDCYSQLVIE